MIGGGEFIINGAERVVVSQLHRSPGVDFVSEMEAGDRKLHSCRIIPERGSWIELNISKKDTLTRPHRPERQVLGHDAAAGDGPEVQPRTPTCSACSIETTDGKDRRRPQRRRRSKARSPSTTSSIPPAAKRPARSSLKSGQKITKNVAELICTSGLTSVEVMPDVEDAADLQQPGGRQHRRATKKRCCAFISDCAGQSAAVGKGAGVVPRKVLRHESLPAGPRRPFPHQPQVEARRCRKRK